VETDPSNNSATDVDTISPTVDLAVTKTSNVTSVIAGQQTTYTIVVTNNGPNAVVGAQVVDNFPATLTTVSFTSVASGGATGNSNGSGNILNVVDMPVNSSITYTVIATIDPQASGQLVNQATVTAPTGVVELNTDNNASTDTDQIDQALAEISGFVYVDLDDDGVKDAGEPPIPGVEIVLERNGVEVETAVTDSAGFYQFDDLAAATFDVLQTQPAGFLSGKMTVGGGIGTIAGDNHFSVPLQSGDDANNLNFGERPIQPSKRSLLASHYRTD
jgi:uncharacterized repeat protein (TIGR01451 family)